jgi:Cu+-exporting ATPase
MIHKSIPGEELVPVTNYVETAGKGLEGLVGDMSLKLGSAGFTGFKEPNSDLFSKIYLSINETVRGYFAIRNVYRNEASTVINDLKRNGYRLAVISGDTEAERSALTKMFGNECELLFNQSPSDKLRYVQHQQDKGRKVLMIGDGLNDAGALKQSDVGISISDDINNFSHACDGILDASRFSWLNKILHICKSGHRIIHLSFIIALLYNLVGLSYAVTGMLSPVVAAILMPLSAITIISFTTGSTNWVARRQI